jgi:hypothetical protein
VNTVMNLRVPQNGGKFLSGCATGGSSRRAELHGVILKSRRALVINFTYVLILVRTSPPR